MKNCFSSLPSNFVLCQLVLNCFLQKFSLRLFSFWKLSFAKHLSNFGSFDLKFDVRTYIESQKQSTPSSVMLNAAAPCGVVPCPALRCCAVLCRAVPCCAVPCCAFSFVHIEKRMYGTYMHAASGLFSWSMDLLAFASRLFAPKMVNHLPHLSFRSVLPCERA